MNTASVLLLLLLPAPAAAHPHIRSIFNGYNDVTIMEKSLRQLLQDDHHLVASKKMSMQAENVVLTNEKGIIVHSCSDKLVTLGGENAESLKVGNILLHFPSMGDHCLEECGLLVRRINKIQKSGDEVITETSHATFSDFVGHGLSEHLAAPVEPTLCTPERRFLQHNEKPTDKRTPPYNCSTYTSPEAVDISGKCKFSNCCINVTRQEPSACYVCGTKCNNGCGPAFLGGGASNIPFGKSCCAHDHCYDSTFSKEKCDNVFYQSMQNVCLTQFRFPLLSIPCQISAFVFYALVAGFGNRAFKEAQAKEQKYVQTEACSCGTM